MAALEPVVDIPCVQQLAGVGIDHQDLARAYPALVDHVLAAIAVGADLRSQGNKPVLGLDPARRTQAVAVQQADGIATVGQDDARRTIPGLHVH